MARWSSFIFLSSPPGYTLQILPTLTTPTRMTSPAGRTDVIKYYRHPCGGSCQPSKWRYFQYCSSLSGKNHQHQNFLHSYKRGSKEYDLKCLPRTDADDRLKDLFDRLHWARERLDSLPPAEASCQSRNIPVAICMDRTRTISLKWLLSGYQMFSCSWRPSLVCISGPLPPSSCWPPAVTTISGLVLPIKHPYLWPISIRTSR